MFRVEVDNVRQGAGAPPRPTGKEGRLQLLLPARLRHLRPRILADYQEQNSNPNILVEIFTTSLNEHVSLLI